MATPTSTLRSWASLLGFLDGDVASAVETMARRLQPLMNADPHPLAGPGEPDGYDGIDRRGELDRLLLSEWMLADEEPLEFLRRFAMSELSYLRREQVELRSSTRLILLADSGPDQLGGPRLVHLAGLVVLHRRAEALGIPLALGILGDDPGAFVTGELPEQFAAWRQARSAVRPTRDHLRAWFDGLDETDHGWLFGAETALADVGGAAPVPRLRHLAATELEWAAGSATSVEVDVDGRRLRLPLPEPVNAIALLRGHGMRRRTAVPIEQSARVLRYPRFTGHARRLLCRTDRPDQLVALAIPPKPFTDGPKPRLHQFAGPVLAAAVVGTRTVALVEDAGSIVVTVVGKHLGQVDSIRIPPSRLELDQHAIASIVEEGLEPLLYSAGRILVRIQERWWFIEPPADVAPATLPAAAPSTTTDSPRIAYGIQGRIHLATSPGVQLPGDRQVLFGPLDSTAYESAPGEYTIMTGRRPPVSVRLEAGVRVVGVTATRTDGAFLVVQTAGERILRLDGPERSRTLTMASGDVREVTVHPTEPLLAIQRDDGAIEAFELPGGEALAVLLPDRS